MMGRFLRVFALILGFFIVQVAVVYGMNKGIAPLVTGGLVLEMAIFILALGFDSN